MRAYLIVAILLGCDAGPPPEKPAPLVSPPRPPALAPALIDAAIAQPAEPHAIEWEVGGLGSWKGKVVGGMMWRVQIDLDTARIVIRDPGEATTHRTLSPKAVQEYARLAAAVRAEPQTATSTSCTDRSESLRVDNLVVSGTCPIAQPGAAALITAIGRELH